MSELKVLWPRRSETWCPAGPRGSANVAVAAADHTTWFPWSLPQLGRWLLACAGVSVSVSVHVFVLCRLTLFFLCPTASVLFDCMACRINAVYHPPSLGFSYSLFCNRQTVFCVFVVWLFVCFYIVIYSWGPQLNYNDFMWVCKSNRREVMYFCMWIYIKTYT